MRHIDSFRSRVIDWGVPTFDLADSPTQIPPHHLGVDRSVPGFVSPDNTVVDQALREHDLPWLRLSLPASPRGALVFPQGPPRTIELCIHQRWPNSWPRRPRHRTPRPRTELCQRPIDAAIRAADRG